MAPTPKQKDLFDRLASDRVFPEGTDLAKVKEEFATLTVGSASAWIDKAMTLPRAGGDDEQDGRDAPPAF